MLDLKSFKSSNELTHENCKSSIRLSSLYTELNRPNREMVRCFFIPTISFEESIVRCENNGLTIEQRKY